MATFNPFEREVDELDLTGLGLGAFRVADLTKPRQARMQELVAEAKQLEARSDDEAQDDAVGVMAQQIELMLEDADGVGAALLEGWNTGRVGLKALMGAAQFVLDVASEQESAGNA
jgi:hypothetical protein